MRLRDLERLMLEWQSILGLLDWDIELVLAVDADDPEAFGTADWDIHGKTATIYVRPRVKEQEKILVHELLHLIISPLTKDGVYTLTEQAIEALSGALVALKGKASG